MAYFFALNYRNSKKEREPLLFILLSAFKQLIYVIIYQSSKLSFSCVLLVESVSREIDEIKLSPSHQRERETMHYSPVNNEKKSRAPSREHATFGQTKTANVFLNSNCIYFTALNLPFFTKLIKYFEYFYIKFALSFRFFDSWYIMKYLLTETSGKQYVLWTLDCRCFPRLRLGKHRQSRVHKTYCFPRSQSISVNYLSVGRSEWGKTVPELIYIPKTRGIRRNITEDAVRGKYHDLGQYFVESAEWRVYK